MEKNIKKEQKKVPGWLAVDTTENNSRKYPNWKAKPQLSAEHYLSLLCLWAQLCLLGQHGAVGRLFSAISGCSLMMW